MLGSIKSNKFGKVYDSGYDDKWVQFHVVCHFAWKSFKTLKIKRCLRGKIYWSSKGRKAVSGLVLYKMILVKNV